MRYRIPQVVLLLALTCICWPALADTLTMRDGSTIEGNIVSESASKVVIETKIANIRTTQTVSKRDIREVAYAPLADDFWDSDRDENKRERKRETEPDPEPEAEPADDADPLPARTSSRSRADRVYFIEVPIHGQIGVEVNTHGLREALTNASRQKIEHIVFTIDSPGGYVYQAMEMMKILKEFDDKLTYHAVIEEGAISAASIFAACADDIFVRPDSRLGGAVSFSTDSTGSAAVDAKMNSIWAAELAARAESKGHPAEVFRAMVVLDAVVWQAADGKISAVSSAGAEQIDGPSTILTIRAGQMVKAGMAHELDGELDELGGLLAIEGWTERKGVGVRAMEKAAKDWIKLYEDQTKASEVFDDAYGELERSAPRQFTDYIIYQNPRTSNNPYSMEGKSLTLWRERSDKAIGACETMLEALKEFARINHRAENLGAEHLLIPERSGDQAYENIARALEILETQRNKPPLSSMVN